MTHTERTIDDYRDIIDMEYCGSKTRRHMPPAERAAQFMPFASLKGYDDRLDETGRIVSQKEELSEDQRAELNRRLAVLVEQEKSHPEIAAVYFQPDARKSGGSYEMIRGRLRRIREGVLCMDSGIRIPADDLYSIESSLFEEKYE